MAYRPKKRKTKKNIASGILHIHATFNNTIITITDEEGKVICWSSAGASGFKGSRKSTPFAAQLAAEKVVKEAKDNGLKTLRAELKGHGHGKDAAVKTFQSNGIEITKIKDVTPRAHNGCRLPKSKLKK